MKLTQPFIITARLMAGLKIGEAYISMGQGARNAEGRTQYGVWIDLPDGTEHDVTDLRSGRQGGDLQEGFASLLSFLSAAGESYAYAQRQGKSGMDGDNAQLFPEPVTARRGSRNLGCCVKEQFARFSFILLVEW